MIKDYYNEREEYLQELENMVDALRIAPRNGEFWQLRTGKKCEDIEKGGLVRASFNIFGTAYFRRHFSGNNGFPMERIRNINLAEFVHIFVKSHKFADRPGGKRRWY